MKKITGTHLGITVLLSYFMAQFCLADNEITIDQSGDNLDITIEQVGANNIIKEYDYSSYIEGGNLDLMLVQYNDTSTNNVIEYWHLDGSGNTVRWWCHGNGHVWGDCWRH